MLLVNIYFFTFRNDEELEEYDKIKQKEFQSGNFKFKYLYIKENNERFEKVY